MKRRMLPILFVLTSVVTVMLKPPALRGEPFSNVTVKSRSYPVSQKTNTISYKGVRFNYDSSLAPTVEPKTIPANVAGKPSDIVPEHPAFTLVGYSKREGWRHERPQIRVFNVAKFREAVATASKEDAKQVVYPPNPVDWTVYFDEEVRVLKALLTIKPAQANIRRFLAKARGKKGCRAEMPFLPMWEACQAFVGHVRYVNFKNGKGVFFLTQWDVGETSRVTNQGIEYAYQGITDDGKHYVYAEFSVAAPFLPNGDEPEVIAWNGKNYLIGHHSKKYQNYLRPILAKLEALPSPGFQPNLELLEQLIGTLEVGPEQN